MYWLKDGLTVLILLVAAAVYYTPDLEQIYVQNIRSISDLYTRKAPLQVPLGFWSKHETQGVDLRSKLANLQ